MEGGDDEVFGGLGDDAIDGGAGDDVLLGNEGNDRLGGGEGDDHLIGNNGKSLIEAAPDTDVAVFSSPFASYTITQNPDGTVVVTDNVGTDGIDTFESIERLQFADRTTLVDGTTAPQIASIQNNDTFVFGDDVMSPTRLLVNCLHIMADAGNDVAPAEKLRVDMPTASAEVPPTIGIPVSGSRLTSTVTALRWMSNAIFDRRLQSEGQNVPASGLGCLLWVRLGSDARSSCPLYPKTRTSSQSRPRSAFPSRTPSLQD